MVQISRRSPTVDRSKVLLVPRGSDCRQGALLVLRGWRPGSLAARDGVKWNRTKVTAIDGRRLVPVHEEHLTLCDDSTALPEWQCAATPIVRKRRARLDAINDDGELVPTH